MSLSITRHRAARALAVAVAVGCVTPIVMGASTQVPQSAVATTSVTHKSDPAESGQELFRQIIFGQGELPLAMQAYTPDLEQTTESRKIAASIMHRLNEGDFYSRFAKEITSGSAARVDSVLRLASEKLDVAIEDLGLDRDAAAPGSTRYAAIALVLFAVSALVVGTVAVLITAAVSTKVKMYGRDSSTASGGLSYERWVSVITTSYAA